jgi:hypothetical protein
MNRIHASKKWAIALAVFACGTAAAQGFAVDFDSSRASGSGRNGLLVENIRVTQNGQQVGYNVLFRLDPVTLELVPEVISQSAGVGASNCAAVSVTVSNAAGARVRGAAVTIGSRTAYSGTTGVASFSGATEGAGSVLVTATGYASVTESATFSCAGTNAVPVSLTSAP